MIIFLIKWFVWKRYIWLLQVQEGIERLKNSMTKRWQHQTDLIDWPSNTRWTSSFSLSILLSFIRSRILSFCLASTTSVVRWVYSHKRIGNHTRELNPIWSLSEHDNYHKSSSFLFRYFWHFSKLIHLMVSFITFVYSQALWGVTKLQKFNWKNLTLIPFWKTLLFNTIFVPS